MPNLCVFTAFTNPAENSLANKRKHCKKTDLPRLCFMSYCRSDSTAVWYGPHHGYFCLARSNLSNVFGVTLIRVTG